MSIVLAQNVDVVAFRLSQSELGEWWNMSVNEGRSKFSPARRCRNGLFCSGYPKGMVGAGPIPIWKRGSVASEPDYNWRGSQPFS